MRKRPNVDPIDRVYGISKLKGAVDSSIEQMRDAAATRQPAKRPRTGAKRPRRDV
jgi:hypothetical protein